jgi:hypothetical protein
MISSILLVLDEHCHHSEMVTFAAELAGPLGANIVVTLVTSADPHPAATSDDYADESGAARVRRIVSQLTAVGLSAEAATGASLPRDPMHRVAAIAATEHADVIIAPPHVTPPHDLRSFDGAAPTVASHGVLLSRDGPVTIVRTRELEQQAGQAEASRPPWQGPLTRTQDAVPRRAHQEEISL